MKEIYQLNKEELIRTCGNPEGLTTTDAKERLQTYGENTLVEQKKQSVASVFFHQFADLLVIILIAAAIVSMASGNIESTIVIFVRLHALDGQHLPGRRPAVGHELLDAPDGRNGQRMGLYLRRPHHPGPEADPPALAVDQRLRAVLHHAHTRTRQGR